MPGAAAPPPPAPLVPNGIGFAPAPIPPAPAAEPPVDAPSIRAPLPVGKTYVVRVALACTRPLRPASWHLSPSTAESSGALLNSLAQPITRLKSPETFIGPRFQA